MFVKISKKVSFFADNKQTCEDCNFTTDDSESELRPNKRERKGSAYSTVRYGTVRYGTVRYGTVRYGTVRYGTAQYMT